MGSCTEVPFTRALAVLCLAALGCGGRIAPLDGASSGEAANDGMRTSGSTGASGTPATSGSPGTSGSTGASGSSAKTPPPPPSSTSSGAGACPAPLIYLVTQGRVSLVSDGGVGPDGGFTASATSTAATLETFSPATGAFATLGPLCPGVALGVFAFAVDRSGFAYFTVNDGIDGIDRLNLTTLACEATPFARGTSGLDTIAGMAFVRDGTGGPDPLYFIGRPEQPGAPVFLGKIDPTTFAWTRVGPLTLPGLLGGITTAIAGASSLFLTFESADSAFAALARVDTATGSILNQEAIGSIPAGLYSPMALWGGDFYFFQSFSPGPVTRFNTVDGSSVTVAQAPDAYAGAAAATCATPP